MNEPAKKAQPYVCRWRRAIRGSDLPSTTRLVLFTLSTWMDKRGGSCRPTTESIAEGSGLSERSVCTHLDRAESEGWIERVSAGRSGKGWKRNGYQARTPKALKEVQCEGGEGTEPHAEGAEPHDTKALKEVQSKDTVKDSEKEARAREAGEAEEVAAPPPESHTPSGNQSSPIEGSAPPSEPRPRHAPTLDEVKSRARLAMIRPDVAEAFFWHYEGQDWLTGGGTPITNWQAKLMKWKLDERKFSRDPNTRQQDSQDPDAARAALLAKEGEWK